MIFTGQVSQVLIDFLKIQNISNKNLKEKNTKERNFCITSNNADIDFTQNYDDNQGQSNNFGGKLERAKNINFGVGF